MVMKGELHIILCPGELHTPIDVLNEINSLFEMLMSIFIFNSQYDMKINL